MKKVVTFGEIMLRLGAPDHLRLLQSNYLDVSFAGAEANVAVSLANYGITSEFITALPLHPLADRCLEELRGKRVVVDNVLRSGNRIGILYLETGSNMRPSRVWYDREHSAIADISPGSIDWDIIFENAQWFHWSGITPALSEAAAEECRKAISVAKNRGVTISCDINYRKNLWNYGSTASEEMPDLVSECDVIIGNEEDCEKVFGIKPIVAANLEGKAIVDQSAYLSVCTQMFKRFHKCRIMAFSLRGAINANHNTWGGVLFDGSQLYESRRYDITDIVDRVGGGDSFSAGLIYGLLQEMSCQQTLEFAVAASALKHTIKGDYNCVSIDDIIDLVKGDVSGRVKR